MDIMLDKLSDAVCYWKWKYEISHPFFKSEYYDKWMEAKKEFHDYAKSKYMNDIIPQPPYIPCIRLDDMTEHFENYEN